jgi:hypothetical protein
VFLLIWKCTAILKSQGGQIAGQVGSRIREMTGRKLYRITGKYLQLTKVFVLPILAIFQV